jgi:hypothetical protein
MILADHRADGDDHPWEAADDRSEPVTTQVC